ncbi:Asp23/Gls24 family envelope stress response protein [Streptomyces sp. NPDC012421]|uniref:Asp23/Gls24 family envelope stress response protein n=1 Tax=unclassified Streptomyces TaxID=2593676 RepID=UPI0036775B0C
MTDRRAQTLTQAVADAVLAVPGVACLRPGLRGLLRASGPDPRTPPGSALLITWGPGGTVTALRVDVVVRAQHQAARTARAVRAAAAAAASAPPEAVRVNVTGIV